VAERVCLYALVAGANGRLRATGMADEPLRVVRIAGIDAVIGALPRAPKPTMAAMRRYDAVERALMARYASVLPARFGTCAATVDALAASVRDRSVSIRRNLKLVRHRAQMTVRVFTAGSESIPNQFGVDSESIPNRFRVGSEPVPFRVDSEPVQSRLRTDSEYGDGSTRGTEYLARRVTETQVPGASRLRPAVARWVRAERSERHPGGQLAGTVYHLVPRSAAAAYRGAVSRTAQEAGMTTIVSGPWPPYAFTD
jgi:hypothetical protein